jgi:hypothetical protein
MTRRHNFQNLSWFYDLHKRKLLDLDPPYQRRSVWNQAFKDYFVETVLLNYPSPAIFLFEEITDDGRSIYHVVDGKQRLTTLFGFVSDKFPVGDKSVIERLRGMYFSALPADTKKELWAYQFLVEYIPTSDERIIDAIFDRLNRNVAKLSPQELRHAKYDGKFITAAEELCSWMTAQLPANFPRIAAQSRRQMKDVELTAQLLLLLEEGPRGYSQDDLDKAFSDRDEEWEEKAEIEDRFRQTINYIKSLISADRGGELTGSRMRNQADFYSLFGAIAALHQDNSLPPPDVAVGRLLEFVAAVENDARRDQEEELYTYYEAARSASSDKGSRETRIESIRKVLTGNWP